MGEDRKAVTGQQDEMVLVPRNPTPGMLEAAWASAHDENAALVWQDMIEAWELSSQHGEVGER